MLKCWQQQTIDLSYFRTLKKKTQLNNFLIFVLPNKADKKGWKLKISLDKQVSIENFINNKQDLILNLVKNAEFDTFKKFCVFPTKRWYNPKKIKTPPHSKHSISAKVLKTSIRCRMAAGFPKVLLFLSQTRHSTSDGSRLYVSFECAELTNHLNCMPEIKLLFIRTQKQYPIHRRSLIFY